MSADEAGAAAAAGDLRWVAVAGADELEDGQARAFAADGERVALARVGGEIYAVRDECSHDDGPLGDGTLEGCAIQCPRHGARFDVRTGAVLSMPAIAPIDSFQVRIEDGQVLVGLPAAADRLDADDEDW